MLLKILLKMLLHGLGSEAAENIGPASSSTVTGYTGRATSSAVAGSTGLATSWAVVEEPVWCLLRGHRSIVVVAGHAAVVEARLGGPRTLGNLAVVPKEEGIADAPVDLRCWQSRRSSRDFDPINNCSFRQSQPWYVSVQTAPEPL